jgi:Flp pilus assembly pilin Flp
MVPWSKGAVLNDQQVSETATLKLTEVTSQNKEKFVQKKRDQKGVTVVEYAIMLALIAIAVAVAAPNITSAVIGVFSKASSVMNK